MFYFIKKVPNLSSKWFYITSLDIAEAETRSAALAFVVMDL